MDTVPCTRIIGLGSPYGADRLGWRAVEQLEARGFAARYPDGWVRFSLCPSPAQLPVLAYPGDRLVLVDALQGAPFGTLRILSPEALQASPLLSGSHGLGLREMLPLLTELQGPACPVMLLGIGMGPLEAPPPDALPASLRAHLEQVLAAQLVPRPAGMRVSPGRPDLV